MVDEQWEVVDQVNGELQGEILRGLLEAQGIPVMLSQEGAGRAYGLNVGALGEVQILVPTSSKPLAERILQEYYAGEFENTELDMDFGEESEADDTNFQED